MKAKAPGWILMTMEIEKRFTLEDLNLTDRELVDKYWESWGRQGLPFHWLVPMALKLCITKNLARERV
jgi:hypothetical protein